MLTTVLINAMRNAHKLKSDVGDLSSATNEDTFIKTYGTYKQTPWGATFTSLVGEYLISSSLGNNILDVGSGRSSTFKNLMSGHDFSRSTSQKRYLSIDNKVTEAESAALWLFGSPELQCFDKRHIHADVFALLPDWVPTGHKFDVVIIDIEPHGREIQAYDAVASALTDVHLIVLKCIGSMEMWHTGLADFFLREMLERRRLLDYFGVSHDELTRDVFVIATHDEVVFDGAVRNRLQSDGGKYGGRTSCHTLCKQMVLEPSATVFDELHSGLGLLI